MINDKRYPFKIRKKHVLEKGFHPYLSLLCMKQAELAKSMDIPFHTLNAILKNKHWITEKNMKKIVKFHKWFIGSLDREFIIMTKQNPDEWTATYNG